MLKIGYFADGPWSHLTFERLIVDKGISIEFVCVRFDTKDETLKLYCEEYKIDYVKHENINSKDFLLRLSSYECDLFVSMSFNQIFKADIINLPSMGIINCHAGKLPFYRGRNILNWALINDEQEFGITVHFVDEGVDTGDIVLQKCFPIDDNDDYSTLLRMAYVECANVLCEAVNSFKNNSFKRVNQSGIHPVGFYCSQRKEGDELLDWNQTSRDIFNFVRSICNPGPQARTIINGREMKVNRVLLIEDAPEYKGIIGAVLNKDKEGFLVKTNDSFVKVVDFTYEGSIKVGDRFELR